MEATYLMQNSKVKNQKGLFHVFDFLLLNFYFLFFFYLQTP